MFQEYLEMLASAEHRTRITDAAGIERTEARVGERGLEGAEAVLRLRALRASGDFGEYWHFQLAQEKNHNHATRYANAAIPDPLSARKRHLRRIK